MKWVSSFKYLPLNYGMTVANVENKTQRVTFDNNLNGNKVRILFSNKYATQSLKLSRVTIGIEKNGMMKSPAEVTLHDKKEIVLRGGEEIYSDEVELDIKPGDRLAVSIYLHEKQKIQNLCGYWAKDGAKVSYNVQGDDTDKEILQNMPVEEIYDFVKKDTSSVKGEFFFGFSAVQILTEDDVKTVVAFGDSITAMSFFTNALQKKLYTKYPGKVTLLNAGIGGNRLLHDATWIPDAPGGGELFGDAGVRRFEKDVFGTDKVDSIFFMMGINDIMHPIQFEKSAETVSAEYLKQGYTYIAKKAHEHGTKVYGVTIMPCGNAEYPEKWMQAFEKTRTMINEWIRMENPYDGYFDFDAVLRDNAMPSYLKEETHIGDGLHPNTEGGKILADHVELDKLAGMEY